MSGDETSIPLCDEIKAEQRRSWKTGERLFVEHYLSRHAELLNGRESKLELIRHECALRREFGLPVDAAEFARRFPELRDELQRLIPLLAGNGLADTRRVGQPPAAEERTDAGETSEFPFPIPSPGIAATSADAAHDLGAARQLERPLTDLPPGGSPVFTVGFGNPAGIAPTVDFDGSPAPVEPASATGRGDERRAETQDFVAQPANPSNTKQSHANPSNTKQSSQSNPLSSDAGSRRHIVLGSLENSSTANRYTISRLHAQGGLGRVWVASDTNLHREVVYKDIRPDRSGSSQILKRFINEAQITGQLEHPNIVPIYELARQTKDGAPYYTMRFIRGDNLKKVIDGYHERRKAGTVDPLELPGLLQSFVAICNAISYAHSRGVAHRDLKPANVALGEFGEVVVLDWGLAKIFNVDKDDEPESTIDLSFEDSLDQTQQGQVVGTVAYMAPEQAAGEVHRIDGRTDIYSLGAVLFEILTDQIPHQGDSTAERLNAIKQGLVPTALSVDPSVPKPLSAICSRAMALHPSDRYQTATELAKDVQRWLADEPVSAFPEPWWDRGRRWVRKHRALCLNAAAVVLVVGVGLLGWTWTERQRLSRLREACQSYLATGQEALTRDDIVEARLQFTRSLSSLNNEPALSDLQAETQTLLTRVEYLVEQAAHQRATREKFARFTSLRDEAMFHGTLFTGIDTETNLQATRVAAAEALKLFAPSPTTKPTEPAAELTHLSTAEIGFLETGRFELQLLLAEALTYAAPGAKPDPDRLREALNLLKDVDHFGAQTAALHFRRSKYLQALGEVAAARGELAHAEALTPNTPIDHFFLGDAAYQAGRLDDAIQSFTAALQLSPDHFWAHYFLAVAYLKQGQPGKAIAHLTACASRQPKFAWIYLLRGYAHGEEDRFDLAEADFQAARQLGAQDYGFYVNRAAMRIRRQRYTDAIADLEQAVELRPDQYQAYVNLAEVYRRERKYRPALAQLERAIERAPTLALPYRIRAQIALDRSEWDQALKDIDRSLSLEAPASNSRAEALVMRGRVLHQLKRHAEAIQAYDAAIKINPQDPHVARLRADALLELGRGAEAVAVFDQYLKPEHEDPDAFRQRGFERARTGDVAGAIADWTQALKLNPAAPLTRARRGWALLNSASLALDDFDRAIAAEPGNADLYNGRGYARVLLGQYRAGVADAEQATRLSAAAKEPRERIALLGNAACIYAQAINKAAADLQADDHETLAQQYRARTIALIADAAKLVPAGAREGYLRQLLSDPAFDLVRQQEAFAQLTAPAASAK